MDNEREIRLVYFCIEGARHPFNQDSMAARSVAVNNNLTPGAGTPLPIRQPLGFFKEFL